MKVCNIEAGGNSAGVEREHMAASPSNNSIKRYQRASRQIVWPHRTGRRKISLHFYGFVLLLARAPPSCDL